MESTGYKLTTLPLQTQQLHYPPHDPPLPHYSAIFNQSEAEPVISLQISNNSVEEELNPYSPLVEFESPNTQIQVEFAATDNPESDLSIIRGGDGQHTTRPPYHYSDPKKDAYLLGMYLAFLGLVFLKLTRENHTHFPTPNPFIIISAFAYAMAFVDLCILSWIYEHLNNPNFLGCYTTLKVVYYTLCILAFFSLLPVLLTTQSSTSAPPPPPPTRNHFHHN